MTSVWELAASAWDSPAAATAWRETARPDQLPPDGEWRTWYVRGGRGGGKTWTGANNFAEWITADVVDAGEWAIVAPTFGDVRDTCFESAESGLIKALGGKCGSGGELLDAGPYITQWNRSMGQLWLRNGAVVFGDGADDGALRIQGKNLRGLWADEIGLWKKHKTAWNESIRFAVRKSPARIIATGTPKRNQPAISLVKALLKDDKIPKSLLRTADNKAHLDANTLAELMSDEGTALGRQELEGEVLAESEGSLWTTNEAVAIAEGKGLIRHEPLPGGITLGRRVVAVDPSDGEETSDEYAVAVVTIDSAKRMWVLYSDGVRKGPDGNVAYTQKVFDEWEADIVVVEKNHGGQYLPAMLRTAGLPVHTVTASVGKRTRAEPVAAMYGVNSPGVYHTRPFPELEDQMTAYEGLPGEDSPDRLDALVWACSALRSPRREIVHSGRVNPYKEQKVTHGHLQPEETRVISHETLGFPPPGRWS